MMLRPTIVNLLIHSLQTNAGRFLRACKGLMWLILDANILFTAANNPNGKAALVISLGQASSL